ncbi:hypothetical protein [Chitinophaga sp. GbtcB8]|uniref:hypothetical protein n=1 Tax=Chitinophaga sp. GbtcB8 TaxID=2824753 RepID=UPI0020C687B9|nr:hypothetical protein [Chitinophaga sp. GbtcB8]
MHSLLDAIKQNNKLPIRLVSPGFGHLSSEEARQYGIPNAEPIISFFSWWMGAHNIVLIFSN